ncbi:MAG: hypothetical protein GKR90_25175 [Pseudomonadales bacterium]|nr:hypothetical protein [Pseudomonadales bacterium]
MAQYEVTARNFSESSENRMHSDDIAQKFGFKGALVPGVAVYGHLTHPLVERFGENWLANSVCDLRLLKPAYDGDRLILSLSETDDQQTVQCHNTDGELLATLISSIPDTLPAPEPKSVFESPTKSNGRVEIEWDQIEVNQPFNEWQLTIDQETNDTYASQVADTLPLYAQGLVHPHFLLSSANKALMEEYVMPTWIHVGSETRHRVPVRVNDRLTVRSVPLERWQKKGHEFIRLYVSYWREDELTTDIMHTAIYKIAS